MKRSEPLLPKGKSGSNRLYGPIAQLGERSVRIREVKGSNPSRSTNFPHRFVRCGVCFSLNSQNCASFVLIGQGCVYGTLRHNAHSFVRGFVHNDNSPIRNTQPPNGGLFRCLFAPIQSTPPCKRMTFKLFKFIQR